MLIFETKVEYLKQYLLAEKENHADSFKEDISIFFDEDFSINNTNLKFLQKYNSKEEIKKWVDRLLSRFVMKFDVENEQENDFIYDYLENG